MDNKNKDDSDPSCADSVVALLLFKVDNDDNSSGGEVFPVSSPLAKLVLLVVSRSSSEAAVVILSVVDFFFIVVRKIASKVVDFCRMVEGAVLDIKLSLLNIADIVKWDDCDVTDVLFILDKVVALKNRAIS